MAPTESTSDVPSHCTSTTLVHRIQFDVADLNKLPRASRDFVVLAGHMFNELMVLHRLYLSIDRRDDDSVERKVGDTWSLVLLRVMAGKLCEFWTATERLFFGTQVSNEEWIRSNHSIQQPLDRLKKYFRTKNLIRRIRNEYAFHYSQVDIGETLDDLPADTSLEMYLSDRRGNSTYFFSEAVITGNLLASIDSEDARRAFRTVMDELIAVASDALEFLNHVIGAHFTNLQRELGGQGHLAEELEVQAVSWSGTQLPLFVAEEVCVSDEPTL